MLFLWENCYRKGMSTSLIRVLESKMDRYNTSTSVAKESVLLRKDHCDLASQSNQTIICSIVAAALVAGSIALPLASRRRLSLPSPAALSASA